MMVSATTVKGLADRLTKAEALVSGGAVYPVAGLDGYAVVRNGDGTQMYLVRFEDGHENCTCPDFKERQGKAGLPCKHILAAQLADEGISVAPSREAAAARTASYQPKVDPAIGLAAIMAPAAHAELRS